MQPGLNLEFARSESLKLEAALHFAKAAGYEFVEPYVYTVVSLKVNSHLSVLSTSAYHHLNTGSASVKELRRTLESLPLRLSAMDAHTSLLLPQIGVPYIQRALDVAAELSCPIVMSDEGPLPTEWMSLDKGFDLLSFSFEAVIRHAQLRGVQFAIELHNALTARPDYLMRLLERFGPGELGVNFDTGNSFLAGNDPVEYVRLIANRVVHVHIKDIPASQLPERGRVTGTRVGVTVGEGVVDLGGILGVLASAKYQGVLSVECDTPAQARASLPALRTLIEKAKGPPAE